MSWEKMFDSTVLNRGHLLYADGAVGMITLLNGIFRTVVYTSRNVYSVRITLNHDKSISMMRCNCANGNKRGGCIHQAAAMYAIDHEYPGLIKEAEPIKYIKPFKDKFADGYYYFNMSKIEDSLDITQQEYEEANQLITSGQVSFVNFSDHYGFSGYEADFTAKVLGKPVSIAISKDNINNIRCSVAGCGNQFYRYSNGRQLCVHGLATLLMLSDYIKLYNPGDSSDMNALKLLEVFSSDNEQSENELVPLEKTKNVHLIPRLLESDNGLYLRFKIGKNKVYVLDDLDKLIDCYNNESQFTYSRNGLLDFAKEDFTDDSKQLFEFVKEVVKDKQLQQEKEYNSPYYYSSAVINLYGGYLDRFFDMMKDQKIDMNYKKYPNGKIAFREKDIDLILKIKKYEEDGRFEGITIHSDLPKLIKGSQYSYYVELGYLNRISEKTNNAVTALTKYNGGNKLTATIGRRNLSRFYNSTLPVLKKNMTVIEDDSEEIRNYIPIKPVFVFYLDVQNQTASCKGEVRYGDQVKELFGSAPVEIYRDAISEDKAMATIKKYFPVVDAQDLCMHYTLDEDDGLYALLDGGVSELMKLGEVHTTEAFKRLKVRHKASVTVGVSLQSNLLNLDISSQDFSLEEISEILTRYREKKKYYRLKNGDFLSLDSEEIASLDDLLNDLNIPLKQFVKGKMNIPAYRALYLDKMLEENDEIYANRDQQFQTILDNFEKINDAEYEVDDSLKDIMRNYQITGFKWLKTISEFGFGGILADDMGLGKTLEIISLLLDEKKHAKTHQPSLVICPSSLIYNWKAEIDKFAPELKAGIIAGNQNERPLLIQKANDYDVVITSYDLLKRDIDKYDDLRFRYEIADEAQNIKTHTTAAAKASKVVKAEVKFALTGTPIENNLSELWSIFDYLMPGFLYSYEAFRSNFENPIVKENDEDKMERLKKMISPFILRRKKNDVLSDLPEKMEEITYVKFDSEQQKLYDAQSAKITKMLQESDEKTYNTNKISILAELTKIRQICCEPGLLYENYEGQSAKREACMELISNAMAEGHKILLFSQFTSMLDILKKDLEERNIAYYEIVGKTPKEERLELVNRFNNDATPIFLISLKAGGTGLNLTGADIVIHYDPWWNIAAQNQATDRAHRIGQQNVVTVFKLIAQGSIEEKIVELQKAKSDLADAILGGENGNLSSLSKEELMNLLSGDEYD